MKKHALLFVTLLFLALPGFTFAAPQNVIVPEVANTRSWMSDDYFFAPYNTPFEPISGDINELVSIELKARESEDWPTVYRLGRMYEKGMTFDQDKVKAEILLLDAANGGLAKAQMALGVLFNFKGEITKARQQFSKAAKNGIHEAFYELGLFYEYGRGIFRNYKKALTLYKKASQEGVLRSTLRLAYFASTDEPPRHNDAIALYERAITQTEDKAFQREISIEVASIHVKMAEGAGDDSVIFDWKVKAANWGDPHATLWVANAYFHGTSVATDYDKAKAWYERAKDLGSTTAMLMLGYMYANGIAVDINFEKAVQLYTYAAERGNPEAAWNLGLMYQNGQGTARDQEKAEVWFDRAAIIREALIKQNKTFVF